MIDLDITRDLTLAVDPGKHSCAWATFMGDRLWDASLVRGKSGAPPHVAPGAEGLARVLESWSYGVRFVLEQPTVYPGARENDPNDLISIATEGGLFVGAVRGGRAGPTVLVAPRTWKGGVPKDIHQRRILAKLTAPEVARLEAALVNVLPTLRHNVVDAVGIGLWAVGRAA